jgi:hypothetical protein
VIPKESLTDEIAHLLDISQDRVANLSENIGELERQWDRSDKHDASLFLLQSIAGSLSAIAHLMARQDEDVWDKVKQWAGGKPDV